MSGAAAPSPMVALMGRVWAATPHDSVNVSSPVVTAPKVTPTIGLGASAGSSPAGEGQWGVVMTQVEKDALDADMRKDLRDQEAPGEGCSCEAAERSGSMHDHPLHIT